MEVRSRRQRRGDRLPHAGMAGRRVRERRLRRCKRAVRGPRRPVDRASDAAALEPGSRTERELVDAAQLGLRRDRLLGADRRRGRGDGAPASARIAAGPDDRQAGPPDERRLERSAGAGADPSSRSPGRPARRLSTPLVGASQLGDEEQAAQGRALGRRDRMGRDRQAAASPLRALSGVDAPSGARAADPVLGRAASGEASRAVRALRSGCTPSGRSLSHRRRVGRERGGRVHDHPAARRARTLLAVGERP